MENKYNHLQFCLRTWSDNNPEEDHALKQMEKLGISFQHATPQSLFDSWIFWNCSDLPEPLPPYLEIMNVDPMNFINRGLTEQDAINIRDYTTSVKNE